MKPASLLFLSVGLNVALVAAAALLWRQPATSAPAASGQTLRQLEVSRVVTNLPAPTTFVTNRFHWRQLEGTNHDAFVANLRAVGCPERTVRDLVVADVWQRFAASELRLPRVPFWSNGPRRVAAERQHEAQALQLRKDLAAMLRRLFGMEWSPELKRDVFEDENAVCRVLLGEVTEEQFERAAGLILSVEPAKEEVAWRCRNVFLDDDYAELRRRRDDLEQQLRAVLSPAQFEEFSARAGVVEWLFRGDGLEQLKPTAAELRQISLASTQVRPLGWELMRLEESQTEEEKEADKTALKQRIRQILGEARFAEFELLAEDHAYRGIRSFADEAQLPLETAHKLYEVRKLAAEEVRNLRQDKALDPTVRTQRLDSVTATVSREVSALLGPKYGEFLRQTGQWATNANRL